MLADLLNQLGDILVFGGIGMLVCVAVYAGLDARRVMREWHETDAAVTRISRQGKLGLRERLGGDDIAERRKERQR